jgi:hypothetical protein
MSEAARRWAKRVEAWRASGERAEEFSRREGCSASTLQWWASRLKHGARKAPQVRLARVVRTAHPPEVPASSVTASRRGLILIELARVGARIAVEPGADRATLAMVCEVLGVGGAP